MPRSVRRILERGEANLEMRGKEIVVGRSRVVKHWMEGRGGEGERGVAHTSHTPEVELERDDLV